MNRLPALGTAIALSLAGFFFVETPAFAASVVQIIDPFWEGMTSSFQFADRSSDVSSAQNSQFQVGYGWDNGFALSLGVPIVFSDINVGPNALETPRIGNGFTERIEVDALYRVWGDAYNYVAFNIGLALPIQTDPTEEDSRQSTFVIPLSIFGRIDWQWVALTPAFLDYPTFPNLTNNANGGHTYQDGGNLVAMSATLSFLSRGDYSPYLTWTETPPRHLDNGTDSGNPTHTYLTTESFVLRARTFSAGVDAAPFKTALVLTGEIDYTASELPAGESPWLIKGKVRWNF